MPPRNKAAAAAAAANAKREKKRKESYSVYIYKVLKQVHPDTGISSKAMLIVNSFVNDVFERIARESCKIARHNAKATISSREIQTAVQLLLPGELAKHAVSEGTKAVTKYTKTEGHKAKAYAWSHQNKVGGIITNVKGGILRIPPLLAASIPSLLQGASVVAGEDDDFNELQLARLVIAHGGNVDVPVVSAAAGGGAVVPRVPLVDFLRWVEQSSTGFSEWPQRGDKLERLDVVGKILVAVFESAEEVDGTACTVLMVRGTHVQLSSPASPNLEALMKCQFVKIGGCTYRVVTAKSKSAGAQLVAQLNLDREVTVPGTLGNTSIIGVECTGRGPRRYVEWHLGSGADRAATAGEPWLRLQFGKRFLEVRGNKVGYMLVIDRARFDHLLGSRQYDICR